MTGGPSVRPLVNVRWRDGGSHDGVDSEVHDRAEGRVDVAGLAAQGLIDAQGIYWPVCPTRDRRCRATEVVDQQAVWLFEQHSRAPHVLSQIGLLSEQETRGARLFRTLEQLGTP